MQAGDRKQGIYIGDLMAIFAQKFDRFCLYLSEALINLVKYGTEIKILLNKITLKLIGDFIPKL